MTHYGHPTRWERAKKPLLVVLVAGALAFGAAGAWMLWRAPAREQEAAVSRGRDLAQLLCSPCHAVADEEKSPLYGAPPFRTVIDRLTVEGVEDMLAESIALGHDPMPEWTLSSGQIDDLLAYMLSLSGEQT